MQHSTAAMAEGTASAKAFEVPACFLPTSAAPGDIIVRITNAKAEQVTDFWCHSVILYYNTEYFKALLSGGWVENHGNAASCDGQEDWVHAHPVRATIDFADESPESMLQVLNHLYPHLSLQLSKDNWQDTWRLADKLGITDLMVLCDNFVRDEVVQVDPLTVLTWAGRARHKEWYRESSSIVLDRMALGQRVGLDALPLAVQLGLNKQRLLMVQNLFAFADKGRRRAAHLPAATRSQWDEATQEAAAKPSRASGVKLLEAAASLHTMNGYTHKFVPVVERFRPLIGRWGLQLPDDVQSKPTEGENMNE